MSEPPALRLRSLRKKSGLNQKELAAILGFTTELPVSRHERSMAIPSLLTALGYEAVFHVPTSALFAGLFLAVEDGIEERLDAFERDLQESDAKGRDAARKARIQEFFWERRNPDSEPGRK